MSDLNSKLIQAVKQGDLKQVKELISQGANVRADGDYALSCAAYNGHLEVVKHLVSQGADVRSDDDWVLKRAAHNGHLEVVNFLKLCTRTDQLAVFLKEQIVTR